MVGYITQLIKVSNLNNENNLDKKMQNCHTSPLKILFLKKNEVMKKQ